MTIGESSDNNAVEVDGVRFETIMSNRLWTVPIKRTKQDDRTSVVLGLVFPSLTILQLPIILVVSNLFQKL